MSNPRFLVAKYVPDRLRMEPINVGVILWTPEYARARFRGERYDRPGYIDGRKLRSHVNETSNYKRWVTYWRRELARETLVPPAGGQPVARSDPDFVTALLVHGRSSYFLVEAGLSLDPIPEERADEVLEHWYGRLVESPLEDRVSSSETPLVVRTLDRAISEAGLATDPHLQRNYVVSTAVDGGVHDNFEFSVGLANGKVEALYQVLELPKSTSSRNQLTRANAFVFEHVINSGLVGRDRCGAVVHLTQEERADDGIEHSLNVLRTTTRVFDLADDTHGYLPFRDELRSLRPHRSN